MREHPETIWSTQKIFFFFFFQMVGQFAGNQTLYFNNKVGSSETTRGTSNLLDEKFKY